MIAITGTGRSGTSFLVEVYGALGFGRSREDVEMLKLNQKIMDGLSLSVLGAPGQMHLPLQECYSSGELMQWGQVKPLADQLGEGLCSYAARNPVVKDPRLMWTLPVWVAAGVGIEHVAISLRYFEGVTESLKKFPAPWQFAPGEANIGYAYGVGLCISTCLFNHIPFSLLHFPHYLKCPAVLHGELKFPRDVGLPEFLDAFQQVYQEERVHDWG